METEQPLSKMFSIWILVCCTMLLKTPLFVSLVAETDGGMVLGGGGLGRPGHPAPKVGQSAAEELIDSCTRHVCLDQWAQDQV